MISAQPLTAHISQSRKVYKNLSDVLDSIMTGTVPMHRTY